MDLNLSEKQKIKCFLEEEKNYSKKAATTIRSKTMPPLSTDLSMALNLFKVASKIHCGTSKDADL